MHSVGRVSVKQHGHAVYGHDNSAKHGT